MSTQSNYDIIIAEATAQTELAALQPNIDNSQILLNDLTSKSKVAEHRLWAWVVAHAMNTIQELFSVFKKDVDDAIAEKEPGTELWYRKIMLEFQYNYQLYWGLKGWRYNDTTSPAAIASKIVKYCAVDGSTGTVVVKVAGETGGLPSQLGTTEKNATEAYLKIRRIAGTQVNLIALPADILKIVGTIYFNPLRTKATIQADVEAAIIQFNKLIPFNGKYNINKLIDAIQAVDGVTDVVLDNVYYKFGSNPYAAIDREWQTHAGYVKIDNASGNTLADTLTYQSSL